MAPAYASISTATPINATLRVAGTSMPAPSAISSNGTARTATSRTWSGNNR